MSNDRNSFLSVGGPALKAVFVGLGLLGFVATWGRMLADGSFALILKVLEGDSKVPGSDFGLRDSFSGIGPLDDLARTLVVFFWEAIDGSHPKSSAAGIYMAGQMAPVIVVQYLDSLRKGNGASTLKISVWWFIFAAAAIGVSGAVWGIVCLATSPLFSSSIGLDALQEASLPYSPRAAAVLLPATYANFIGGMVLMSLPVPSMASSNFRQLAIIAWNLFPIGISAVVHVAEPLWSALFPASGREPKHAAHLRVVRYLGAGAMALGFAVHAGVTAVSISAAFFPALFAPGYAELLHPLSLAVPPIAVEQAKSPGDGIWSFVVWDQVFGFAFVMLLFLAQLQNAMRVSDRFGSFSWAKMCATSLISSFLIGPGVTIVAISWLRDEILYGVEKKETRNGKAIAKKN
ncbi:hypothetical protein BKA67DRAFT_664450 [Truncatella angustata]|uniref:Uncharacterized protein n=1 Tax=Truncatella angustata TaxID=152316 RepID=A0A9P8U8M7_9PEZI|nr:uncharacterized protein BKA67DRAFT_664450 [Truncatella angustata]KAH6645364.1 hypothetical protein BKA67DRAFT_664450 [Truncatella angustata]KAH8200314.1 hypothetical protein TruAng_005530 [Truncatella angustata]